MLEHFVVTPAIDHDTSLYRGRSHSKQIQRFEFRADPSKQGWCEARILQSMVGVKQGWYNTRMVQARMVQSKDDAKQGWCNVRMVQSKDENDRR